MLHERKDVMEGQDLRIRIEELGRKLGIPEEEIKQAYPEYWEIHYEEVGAKLRDVQGSKFHSRDDEITKCHIIIPTASIAEISLNPEGKYCVLVERKLSIEGTRKLKLPGGKSKMWSYTPKGEAIENVELENPMLTAYREWKEAVGGMQRYPIKELTITTTTKNGAFSNNYNMNIYYYVKVLWSEMEAQVFPKEAVLGGEPRIQIVPIGELHKYPWHPDAEKVFELLTKVFS